MNYFGCFPQFLSSLVKSGQNIRLEVLSLGQCPSSFKAGPVGYSNATVVPYCVMIAYCTEQPVNQAPIFPPQSTGQGNFL